MKIRASRNQTLALILISAVVLTFLPSIAVTAGETSFDCDLSKRSVCRRPDVTLNTRYGNLRTQFSNQMNMFSVLANGTIFFDFVGFINPSGPQNILTFRAQAYGNGSFDIRIKSPPAVAIAADTIIKQPAANSTWGQGVEIIYTNVSPPSPLIVNYAGIGPGCVPICLTPTWTLYIVAIILGPHLIASMLVIRRKKRIDKRPSESEGGYIK